VGLDANYAADIETRLIFPKLLEYHADGVTFWRRCGVHHPFLLPSYTGDGRFYHHNFARIGFTPAHADLVSFVELLHVPTVGRNKLMPADLLTDHLKWLDAVIRDSGARHIFIPDSVARLMRRTGLFPWLPRSRTRSGTSLDTWFKQGRRTVYFHLHFSAYGKFEQRKATELAAIGELLPDAVTVSGQLTTA